MFEQDYILRMVQQLAAALQRAFRALAGREYETALDEVERAYGELFGLPPGILERLGPAGAAALLGHPEKIKGVARLARAEGEIHQARGAGGPARVALTTALGLYDAALERAPGDAEAAAARKEVSELLARS